MILKKMTRKFVRNRFANLMADIVRSGNLILEDPDEQRYQLGDATGVRVHVRITRWDTIFQLVMNPDLAFGEGFMNGDIQMVEGSIYDLLAVVFQNLKSEEAPGLSRFSRGLFRMLLRFSSYNSIGKSKQNVAHHYDLDGRLYNLFLDSDQQYSCAYFETPESTLEEAQLAKKRHLVAKLNVQPGQSVLDIGSGWGGLGLYLARHAQAHVKGITLSEEQLAVSRARAECEGLRTHVHFELQDYRLLNERFDRIVSVGMFEHVGRKSYQEFFAKVRDLLADDGVAVLHYIGRTVPPSETNEWILKYIFPGGYLPSLSEVLPEVERQGLMVTDIEVLRLHYAETLRLWRERFMANREQAVEMYDERFARMWEFYLASSESAFRFQGLAIHQIQMVRDQNVLPLTRDYIQAAEAEYRQREAGPQTTMIANAAE